MAFHAHHAPDALPGYHPVRRRYAWTVFAVLFALMVVDYVDRQVVVSMFSHLKSQWGLSDSQLGALVSVVSVTVALGAVPLSLLADRWSRVKSIFLMALIWSLATLACAFAGSYAQLFAARSVVGLGEAAYGTVGAALLATLFPPRMRSTVLGAFLAASMLGSVLGVVLGGVIAERWGWQAGFGAVGVPGLFLALLFLLTARDYKTVALPVASAGGGHARTQFRTVAAALLRPRSAPIACVGAGLQLLAASTIYAWLPTYFNRAYGLAPDQAGLKAGLVVLGGGIGAVIWSVVADRLSVRRPGARLFVPAVVVGPDGRITVPCLRPPRPGADPVRNADRGRSGHGRDHRADRRRRRGRNASRPACDRQRGPRAHAEHDRSRSGATADWFPFRPLRAASRHGDGPRFLPARRRDVRAGGAGRTRRT